MSRAIGTFAMPPAFRLEFSVVAIAQKRVVVRIGFHKNTSAVAAVPAGRSAARDELLPSKRDAAVPAVPSLHRYFCFVNEHAAYLLHQNEHEPLIGCTQKQKAAPASQDRF